MKAIYTLLLLIYTCSFYSYAQTCDAYFPMKKGALMETTSFNAKGKMESVCTVKIVDVSEKSGGITLALHSDVSDEKGKNVASSDYDASCKDDVFSINMKSMITAEQMEAWKDMTVSIEADDINYPVVYSEGEKLNDAHLKVNMSMSGMNMPSMTIDITDRVLVGKESITTTAGTFECIKITSKVKIKNMIGYEMNNVEWLSKGNGVIRTESFKGDKMKSYSVLTKLEK